jgi:beta-ureidopropionase / N-carbamoyl-L-amino-acid hydrolase
VCDGHVPADEQLRRSFTSLWDQLAPIGRAPSGGYRRFSWTPADLELRAWFADQAAARGMACERDRNGNLWAWDGEPGPGAVVTGSHLDSVPDGGAFDGPLGVVSGFLAVDLLRARGVERGRPLAVVDFADEEGARFGVACIGSKLLTGALDPDRARALRDEEGTTLAEAMQRAGADPGALGRDEPALARIGAFVELHVEQGRGLVDVGQPVAVATAIWPHGRWRLSFRGEANHAGTTRLADRHDPALPFAATVLAARELAGRAGAVATVGRVQVTPNGTNAVPSLVEAWLDARAPDEATLTALVEQVASAASGAAAEHGVRLDVAAESAAPVVDFDHALQDRLARVLGEPPRLPTGAGPDAGILAGEVPTAMLFVRNPAGVSHSPAEHAETDDCAAGVEALAAVLADLVRG